MGRNMVFYLSHGSFKMGAEPVSPMGSCMGSSNNGLPLRQLATS